MILKAMKSYLRLLLIITSLIFTCSWASEAWCQMKADSTAPIKIEADRMESSQEDGAILFSGNVQANQGDLVINADTMTVIYKKSGTRPDIAAGTGTGSPREIETIKAEGNVKIVQDDWVAAGDTMDFDAGARIVILAGDAKAWQNQNMVSGEKIVLYLDEGRSVVESSSREGERVKAFIYPSAEEKKGPETP